MSAVTDSSIQLGSSIPSSLRQAPSDEPRRLRSVETPSNSEWESEVGFHWGCDCCASRLPKGRDGLDQLRVAFTNDFLFDLGAREHKRVTLFRHAESDAEAMSLPMLLSCRCFCPPEIPDPSLSAQGTARATELGLHLAASKFLIEQEIELIVVSPLRRSLQTALLMFPPSTHQIPFVVSPMHREIVSTSSEIGTVPERLQAEFPDFDFSHLSESWWHVDNSDRNKVESHSSVQHRIMDFTAFLLRRREFNIVVIGHPQFFSHWTRQSTMSALERRKYELCAD